MGWRFRRSITVAPGIRVNLGKKSSSVSIGPKGAKVTIGKNRANYSVGVPGTGLYYRKDIKSPKSNKKSSVQNNTLSTSNTSEAPEISAEQKKIWGFIFLLIGISIITLAFTASLITFGRFVIGAIGAFCLVCSVAFLTGTNTTKETDKTEPKRKLIKSPFALSVGCLIMLIMILLLYYSFGWEWMERSKHNIYITYDYSWLKWIFYPLVIIGIAFGGLFIYGGFAGEEFSSSED